MGKDDGRSTAPGVPYVDFSAPADAEPLKGDVIFVTEPLDIATEQTPYLIMHCPPVVGRTKTFYRKGYANRKLITNSKHSARKWAEYLDTPFESIGLAYPFADAAFSRAEAAPRQAGPTRVLFAGRLTADKGFYTLLEALTFFIDDSDFEFIVTTAGASSAVGKITEAVARAHPQLIVAPAQDYPDAMAQFLTTFDVVVMPSHSILWPEPFGMLSVEAQHAGCRVVASNIGGLPETDCGGLHLFDPDNPVALAAAIRRAGKLGRLTSAERKEAAKNFTVQQSVDQLLGAMAADLPAYRPL
ncbi:MAG TPA: glycosyltransferase family 4 protein [Candidatus Saccharimonadales bacterium]|nr:glycosyltransferase family 4 protein [Candidatus Saccharimonadales bacterium]